MRRLYLIGVLFVLTGFSSGKSNDVDKPNVIIILADDLGYSDLGCYGSEIRTPRLDKLADNGLIMTQFYNAARCCPTRASLLTGLYQYQVGVGRMDKDLGLPEYSGYLNDQCVTIAEVLKEAGYNTYHTGKWHIGEKKGQWPLDRGFDRYYGLIDGAGNYYGTSRPGDRSKHRIFLLDSSKIEQKNITEEEWRNNQGFYMTDQFTDYAIKFISEDECIFVIIDSHSNLYS